MSRLLLGTLLVGSLAACSPAHADRARPGPLVATPAGVRAPYDIEILGEDGAPLRTYAHGGRYYVLGERGGRYVVHVSNPTPRRIEAVVTVDGLDVIDGEGGDVRKRGYVIQPYGELRVEGFRTSTSDVATFRFSSVAASYAGRKGVARNVGVIAVALFEEDAPAQVIVPTPRPYHPHDDGHYHREYDVESSSAAPRGGGRGTAKAEAPRPAAPPSAAPGRSAGVSESAAPSASHDSSQGYGGECCAAPQPQRPGLGTEYGEQRYSAVSFTRFVRSTRRPVAVAELRYNDAPGLAALGIHVAPAPDHDELYTRETAEPFPGDHRFSRPPAGVY